MSFASNPMSDSAVQIILERLRARGDEPVLWEQGLQVSGNLLLEHAKIILALMKRNGIERGSIVGFSGEFGVHTIGAFIAILELKAIAVPFSMSSQTELPMLAGEAQLDFWIDLSSMQIRRIRPTQSDHPLLSRLRDSQNPGLIVFTSGSSGKPKAILHDVERVASKFAAQRRGWRMVLFLLIDHFGGFNTLLACLAYGGEGVCLKSRSPYDVCRAISDSRANLLPTTPSFLSLLISSGDWRQHDLSSIELVTYGAEPMPENVLKRLPSVFPKSDFKQTYGLSEVGVLHSISPDKSSLWLRVGGRDFETKVVDGVLHIKSASSMLGYLNAESPIDADGWMNTGDIVEEKGDLIKVIGRRSDVINVGGQKVYPVEVEAILLLIPEVTEATVYGIQHPVLGQVVGAKISLSSNVKSSDVVFKTIKAHCKERLQKYKIPLRYEIIELDQHASERGKKIRRQ